ncbi:F0F1 ATP synthase subunit epsilon [Cardiobacteriaceae bacterium TAE3-ERU3]|nr:F0F1 ATP synthase subunit epsilon [Cardiobacteriaceae bacterium TAE3-ERU3]
MAKTFKATVVSADRSLFEGSVSMIAASSIAGELGILAGHTPLLAALKPGQVRLTKENGEEEVLYVSGGVVEVQPGMTMILADEAERAEELNPERVEAARKKAEERMREASEGKVDYAKAQAQLEQATAQLAAIRRSKK